MRPINLVSLLAIIVWICGCQSRTESTANTVADVRPEPSAAVDESTATRAKPTSPIRLGYELIGEPQIGQALEIRITSRSSSRMSNLTIDVRGDEELLLAVESRQFSIEQVEADEPTVHSIMVTPLYEGSHYLSVTAQAIVDGQVQADYITISIRVGDVEHRSEPMGTLETDGAGETIISLPAGEN